MKPPRFPLSLFGTKLSARSGILELMDDLGEAMTSRPDMIMMGGGNPAHIPAVQEIWRARLREMLGRDSTAEFDRMLSNYDPPQGNPGFLSALADFLNATCGWNLTAKNIAITSGGQSAFFFLFNTLAGEFGDSQRRRILLPLVPEYIGYANQGIGGEVFRSRRPLIEEIDDHVFKYHVDFENLPVDSDTAAICVSRPTNPSGNVLTDAEIARLAALAEQRGLPLIIDNAYGAPFPGAIFGEATPLWNENIILTLSLSKLGLPGTRTGIVVAHEDIVSALASMTAIAGLSNNNIGQTLVRPMLENGELLRVSRELIRPFYRERSERTQEMIHEAMGAAGIPYRFHRSEGAFFIWLSFPGLPIPTRELYERLKARSVLVVPGEYFFFGLDEGDAEDWPHQRECLRMTYSMPEETVRRGIAIIADEVRAIYGA